MKTLSIFAAAMVVATAANAQGPTNQFQRATRAIYAPEAPGAANTIAPATTAGGFAPAYSSYSQDSYIEQTGPNNYSNVNQTDGRAAGYAAGSGSSAIVSQTGSANNANQVQSLDASSNVAGGRNLVHATQAGTRSQSDQIQVGGATNLVRVEQGANTSDNRAKQTQNGGLNNDARITQTKYAGYATPNTLNYAEQTQSGERHTALIEQQGNRSYAKQTQSGTYGNDAYIGQGSDGARNTAMQTQAGSYNNAAIRQSVGTASGASHDNYAKQTQIGFGNQADITQRSSSNFAEQNQNNSAAVYQNNNSQILQENVSSAAYTTQTGMQNTAIVHQH